MSSYSLPTKDGSAFWGNPPASQHDKDIMIGLLGSTKPPHKVPITDPTYKGTGLFIGLVFAIVITFFVTLGRLLTRALRKGQKFGADDWVIIPAVLVVLAYFGNILSRVPYACAGKHINYCTYKELGLFFELGGIGQVMFFAASTLIKISMTLFNRRLTGISSARWQVVHYAFLALLVVWFFITLFINIFQCRPVTAFFNFSLKVHTPSYHCLNTNTINYSFVVINAITDFCLLCVPIVIIAKVRMPLSRKLRMMAMFCLGAICCATSTVRIVFIHRSSKDFTYKFPQNVSLTIVDLFFGAFVASLPALNAFAETAFINTKKSFQSYYRSATGRSPRGASDSVSGPSGVLGSGADESRSRSIFGGKGGFLRASSKGGDSVDVTLKSQATTIGGSGGPLMSKKGGIEIEEDRIALGTAHSSENGDHNGVNLGHGVPELRGDGNGSFFEDGDDEERKVGGNYGPIRPSPRSQNSGGRGIGGGLSSSPPPGSAPHAITGNGTAGYEMNRLR